MRLPTWTGLFETATVVLGLETAAVVLGFGAMDEVGVQPGSMLQLSSALDTRVQTWQLMVVTCFGTAET